MTRVHVVAIDIPATQQSTIRAWGLLISWASPPAGSWSPSDPRIDGSIGDLGNTLTKLGGLPLCIRLNFVDFEVFGGFPVILDGVYLCLT